MELAGRVIAVLEPKGGTSRNGNEWKVQEYVIETHDQYPRRMCFDVFGDDKIKQFNIQVGEELNVSFDIDAREWQGRWFNSIDFISVRNRSLCPMTCNNNRCHTVGHANSLYHSHFLCQSIDHCSGKCSSGRLLHDRRERRPAVLNEYGNLNASFASGKMK